MDKTKQQQQHVVALALPAQGHLNALMRVCKLLTQQEGFIVTVVDFDLIHNRVQQLHNSHEAAVKDGPLAAGDGDGDGDRLIRRAHVSVPGIDLSQDFNFSFRTLFEALLPMGPALLSLIRSLHPPPTCLLADFTITLPTLDVADQLAIPWIAVYPFCASRLLLLHYVAQGNLVSMDEVSKALATSSVQKELLCEGLPGLPTLYNIDLPHFKHVRDDSVYIWNLSVQSWKICNARANSILVNSFDELEASAFTTLSKICRPPIYAIGPLIGTLHEEYVTSLWREDEACIAWLDQQPTSSVLYLSFGSITVLSETQFHELLNGLLSSKQRFLWAFRPGLVNGSPSSSTPAYIMSNSHGRGFVVGWAPQVKVLAHPSVAGFVTHCGWNSIIESIAHGVPMLCWPYFADQPFNARCIVEEWKLGLEFEASEQSPSFVRGDEVERAIESLMKGVAGQVVKKNIDALKEACHKCLLHNGSSYKNLITVIGSLNAAKV